MLCKGYNIRRAEARDISTIAQLENISFPPEEAASEATIALRQQVAGEFFYVATDNTEENSIIAFINATLTDQKEVVEESMSTHVPSGDILVIHSVTVQPSLRRQGIATEFLKNYIQLMATEQKGVTSILLLTKEDHLRLYQSVGFTCLGKANCTHGGSEWFECRLDLEELRRQRKM